MNAKLAKELSDAVQKPSRDVAEQAVPYRMPEYLAEIEAAARRGADAMLLNLKNGDNQYFVHALMTALNDLGFRALYESAGGDAFIRVSWY